MKRILLTLFVIGFAVWSFFSWKQDTVYAVGDLTINWQSDPLFVVANMLPGDTESRTVEVVNGASTARAVAVRGVKTSEILAFAGILDFVIQEESTEVWSGKLQDFFDEPSIALSTLGAGATTHYTFTATFPASAGNEYQGAEVVFDIIFGIDSDIPAECADIEFSGEPIFGTDGDDTIRGTRGNDLVFALEGDDYVTTFGGDDCIVGGPGDDELRGETGKDIIFGNEGDDLVIGAVGKDLLFGGDGNDTIRGENNEDQIYGGNGDDYIRGGNGADVIHGDNDNDTLWGENGNDSIFGDAGVDSANGHNGTDSCDAEVEIQCEL